MSRRLDLDGARHALQILPAEVDTTLLARLRELPVLLRRTGLVATLATVMSRRDRAGTGAAYAGVAQALASVIALELALPQDSSPEDVLTALTGSEPASHAAAARQADRMMVWLKRLAEARHHATPADPGRPEDHPRQEPDPTTAPR